MNLMKNARRYLGAALLTSLLATLASFGSVGAATLVVSGESLSTITLTLADTTAEFGTNLTPTGVASNGEARRVVIDAPGACYLWPSTVTISSNIAYDVTVASAAANTRLDFLTALPATYAACTSGTAIPAGSFTPFNAQAVTASRAHGYALGLNVAWLDAPSATLGNATLTLEAIADV